MGGFDGKVALVTGGGSGIGRATALAFAEAGARIVVADVDAEGGRATAASVDGIFVQTDVSDPEQNAAAFTTALERFGRVDLAHLNAGVGERSVDLTDLERDAFDRSVGVNVAGVVFGTRAAARAMADGGAIVATASLAGLVPFPSDPIYGLTKHAVIGFVRSAADQLRERGIRINAVCPGFANTPMLAEMVPHFEAAGMPLLSPEEVAAAVMQAATSELTGQAFVCQPGLCDVYRFRGVPGPRVAGAESVAPPPLA